MNKRSISLEQVMAKYISYYGYFALNTSAANRDPDTLLAMAEANTRSYFGMANRTQVDRHLKTIQGMHWRGK